MAQTFHKMIKRKAALFFVWIAFSLITGFSIAAIITTNGNLERFYNRGDFLPFYLESFTKNGQNILYEAGENKFTVTEEGALFRLNNNSRENEWKYLKADLTYLSAENLDVQMLYYDRGGNMVGEEVLSMEVGEHVYDIAAEAFSSVVMVVNDPVGTAFSISEFQFSTELPEDNTAFPAAVFLGTLLALGITALFFCAGGKRKKVIEWYRLVDGLQSAYLEAGNRLFRLRPPLLGNMRSMVRIGIMILMFVVLSFVNVYNLFFDEAWHPFVTLFLVVCILLLAFFYIQKPLEKKSWKNPLVASWGALWLMSCVSDFFVTKTSPYYAFYGYLMTTASLQAALSSAGMA